MTRRARFLAGSGFGIALLIAALSSPGAQAPSAAWTPELMMTVKRVSEVIPSPGGRQVAFVVGEAQMEGEKSEWLSHVHLAAADGSGSRQLTRGDKSATVPRWSPDGKWIAFVSGRSGKTNVWRISPTGGEAEMITDEKGGVSTFEWAPDGQSIAFVMKEPKTDAEEKADKEKRDWRTIDENIKMNRLYVAPVEKGADGKRISRLLTSGALSVNGFSWAPDGRTIVFAHQKSPSNNDGPTSDISQVSVADAAVKPLLSGRAAESKPIYSPDGRSIAFVVSDDPPSWATQGRVQIIPAGGGPARSLAATPDALPSLVGWSADGSRVLVGETHGVAGRMLALPVDGGAAVPLEGGPLSISAVAINRSGTTLGYVAEDVDRAPEPFVAAVGATLTSVASVQPTFEPALGRSEAISWKSTDGRSIEGLLTYPVGYKAGARVPLLLVVHGGPAGAFVRSFIGTASPYPIAAFAARGYAILRANPRGSSGYGREFRYANKGDWGGGDYRDLMSGVDHVVSMGVADPAGLGVMGWSYGGFMTAWVVTQTKRFKAASAGAAITNLMSFTGVTDSPGFVPDYFSGEYWDMFDKWRAHSPLFSVKGVTTPTLIQHGEGDERVPVSQGYEFYNALKRQGVPTKLTVYPRQPHSFTEPKMTLDAARANLEWFDRLVLGRAAGASNQDQGRADAGR
jgi:dipeptidyl aminopeptidase/acylaminoacyl peptidase